MSNVPGTKPPDDNLGAASTKSFEDDDDALLAALLTRRINLLRSEITSMKEENKSFHDNMQTSLDDAVSVLRDEIKLTREESKARHDEIIKELRGESPREESEENGRKELSSPERGSSNGDGVVETTSDGAPSGEVEAMNDVGSDEVEGSSCLLEDEESVEEDDVEAPPAVGTSNHKGKKLHPSKKRVVAVGTSNHQLEKNKRPTKKKKKSMKKKAKSKKNRASNNSSNTVVTNNSSTNSYYWGANGGVSLKVVKRVVMGLMSIACLLSMTFGHGNMEEQHNDSSPRKKHTLQQHESRTGLISKASSVDAGEGPAAARILQTTEFPTWSPTTSNPTNSPTVDLIYEGCDDTLGWVDEEGDGCQWYEKNDQPGCPVFGNEYVGDMGPAKDNCCHCFATASPTTSSHPTSSSNPTYSPTTSSHPTSSSHPTYSPTTSDPTSSSNPSNSPSASSKPTSSPTASSHPTSSAFPTDLPSLSSHPTSSSKPSNSPTTTLEQKCPAADKTTCGCDVVFKSDYRGTIKVTAGGAACIRWDESDVAKYPNAGLEDNNFCRHPYGDSGGLFPDGPWCRTSNARGPVGICNIPACDPCKCIPSCGQPLNETCPCHNVLQSRECCDQNDAGCKCKYLKDACRISLQNNSADYCEEAEAECCKSMGSSSNSDCECLMYEDICTDFPGEFTCDAAVGNCCDDWHEECLCHFYEYTSSALDLFSDRKDYACRIASNSQGQGNSAERGELEELYNNYLGGEYWITNTNWLNNTVPHCDWFGIKCNDGGHVTEINLSSNNLTGIVDSDLLYILSFFSELAKLDLSNNNLQGRLVGSLYNLRNLEHLDISGNNLSGHAPMLFSATTSYVNLSHNNITSISFRRSIPSYESLEVLDVSNNKIDQDISHVLRNIPPNLVQLDLSHNSIEGAIAEPFPNLHRLQELSVANNRIKGMVPDFSRATPLIRVLDLSNQQLEMKEGLTGTIPPALSKLDDLTELYLAGNKLSGSIPTQFGNFLQLKVLNLSSNALVSSIPVELGRLDGSLDVLDVSQNILNGVIPSVLGQFPDIFVMHLSGNRNLSSPAPLSLCSMDDFDVMDDSTFCPTERNALKAFYQSAKGSEWTNSDGWLDEYTSYCKWHGVTCYCEKEGVSCSEANSDLNVYQLTLKSNSLSGNLDTNIGNLSLLAVLDLRDNDIKGSVPTEIGSLSKLTRLQLSYNTFRGTLPSIFSDITSLQLIHLHANRFSGVIPLLDSSFDGESSFIADCGYPSLYEETLTCTNCTMCCNSQDECTPTDKVERLTYMQISGVVFACAFGVAFLLALAVYTYYNRNTERDSAVAVDRPNLYDYEKFALDDIGNESVYKFLLGTSRYGWAIVLATIATQLGLLYLFVQASEIVDWTQDKYDFVYKWKCSWDDDECDDKSDLDWKGWAAFSVLMGVHVLEDIISGLRLIAASAYQGDWNTRIRHFIGGWLLVTVTSFTVYASAVYNAAIATSNTDIIMNSVVILFMLDIDELVYGILGKINHFHPLEMMSKGMPTTADIEAGEDDQRNDQTGNALLKKRMNQMQDQIDDTKEQNANTFGVLEQTNCSIATEESFDHTPRWQGRK